MDGNRFGLGVKFGAATCLTLVIFALSGCGEQEAGTTNKTPVAAARDLAIKIPAVDALRSPLAADGFDTIDFMALSGCELQKTLGKYQSSLGRRASDSQRLLLELEYLRLAPQCIRHKLQLEQTALAARLEKALDIKRDQLPVALFNATLANTEFQQFWHNCATAGKHPAQQRLALRAMQAIGNLAGLWLSGDYRASNIEFEILLSEIARGDVMLPGAPDRKALHSIVQLELQLAAVLPPQYLAWSKERGHFFAGLERPTKLD